MIPKDPIELKKVLWPEVRFYDKQVEIIRSVEHNRTTLVRAGNMLGKDFIAGFIVLWFFLTRSPCRVVTTSADHGQLEAVLWGEIRRFIQTSKYPLDSAQGGPLLCNHLHIRRVFQDKTICPLSYIIGRVAAKGEGLLGHHIADTGDGVVKTLFVGDEASGVDDVSWDAADTWADRKLAIGNCYPCNNFFSRAVLGGKREDGTPETIGDIPSPTTPGKYLRKLLQIKATDSPNVRRGQYLESKGISLSSPGVKSVIIPGVLPYDKYKDRLATWDSVRISIGLNAEFYTGAEVLMFPPGWLDYAEKYAEALSKWQRSPTSLGIDPAEGGDDTSFALGDMYGLLNLISYKTPDTVRIVDHTIHLINAHKINPRKVFIDRGGGGKQIADQLRRKGYRVETVSFGESIKPQIKRGMRTFGERLEIEEGKAAYKTVRAEMYDRLRQRLNPASYATQTATLDTAGANLGRAVMGFTIPARFAELRRQLSPIPLLYDEEGRVRMLPKGIRGVKQQGGEAKTLTQLIGRSPDDADAIVLMLYAESGDRLRNKTHAGTVR